MKQAQALQGMKGLGIGSQKMKPTKSSESKPSKPAKTTKSRAKSK